MREFSRALLDFSIRLYTRLHDREQAKLGILGVAMPKQSWWLDNGKRSIKILLTYGPEWVEEEDGLDGSPSP